MRLLAAIAAMCCLAASSASAGELLLGAYQHDVGPAHREHGADIEFGYRTDPVPALNLIWNPSIHVFGQVNTDVNTHFIAAGLSWKVPLGQKWFVRPGIGLAYTTGEAGLPPVNAPGISPAEVQRRLVLYRTRKDFGSKELFEPELSVGYQLSPRWAAELSYVHYSNGQIFHQGTNQGLDDIGLRLAYRFGVK